MVCRTCLLFASSLGIVALFACESGGPPGGEGGACDCATGLALVNVTIEADEGPLPADTAMLMDWSGTPDGPVAFALDDPSTWNGRDTTGIECDLDRDAAPPEDLDRLVCDLWTAGATHVVISAAGCVTYDETLTPKTRECCGGYVRTHFDVVLRHLADAGID